MDASPTSDLARLDPDGPPLASAPTMSQWWRDVCFLHWRVDPAAVARLLPPGTRPDLYDGAAMVGLIPFRMVGAGLGRGPGVPFLGTFLETNVRTYTVDERGRRGVAFLSLDAQRLAVVAAARLAFGVPYRWARMQHAVLTTRDGRRTVSYRSQRLPGPGEPAASVVSLTVGAPLAAPTSLDVFLTARFGLHTSHLGRTLWVPNTHRPWPLHDAQLVELDDSLVWAAGLGGIVQGRPPDSLRYSPGVRTEFGRPVLTSAPGP